MRKTAIWTILGFSPLPPINDVEEQWAKLESSNVMDLQPRRNLISAVTLELPDQILDYY